MSGRQSRDLLFEVQSALGYKICITRPYWFKILRDKHPAMRGKEQHVQRALTEPLEVRRSKSDPHVYLYYRQYGKRFICVIARHQNSKGFVITTYISDNIKEGEIVWKR
jgi:hypothetical protein